MTEEDMKAEFAFIESMTMVNREEYEALKKHNERLGKEVEDLMKVNYWQDRYNIVLTELNELKSHLPKVPTQPYEKELAQKLAIAIDAHEEIISTEHAWEGRSTKKDVSVNDLKEISRSALEKLK